MSHDPTEAARLLAYRYHVPGFTREDTEQEAMLSILTALRDGHSLDQAAETARQHLRHLIRKAATERSRTVSLDLVGELAARSPPSPDSDELWKMIESILPPKQYLVLHATYVRGTSDSAIAHSLGLTRADVHQARSRALKKISASPDIIHALTDH